MQENYRVPVTEHDRIRAELAAQLVAASAGVAAARILSPGRDPRERRARWMAIYLCYVSLGWSIERTAHAFGVNRTSAANACRWAEDERDRPAFDAALERVESLFRDSLQPLPAGWLTGAAA